MSSTMSPQMRSNGSVSAVAPVPAPPDDDQQNDMYIERGQYDAPTGTPKSSGSALLDLLTSQARAANASDLILTAGSAAFMRVNGQLTATNARSAIDGDLLSRELGVVAPPEARSAWMDKGTAMFTYGDGLGRVRVTLTRDHRGPGASLRLLVGEPPTLEELGLAEVDHWLDDRGLILIGGPSGAGKTTTLAAMVRGIGEHRRRVVALEDPIEIVHVSPWISQRAIREHVPNVTQGVEAAMREGVDAIVIGSAQTPESAAAVIEAAIGGHLVITTVVSPTAEVAAERLIDRLPADSRKGAEQVIAQMLLGRMAPIIGLDGERTFEVVLGPPRR
jgi:twitching motility protein PilT